MLAKTAVPILCPVRNLHENVTLSYDWAEARTHTSTHQTQHTIMTAADLCESFVHVLSIERLDHSPLVCSVQLLSPFTDLS